MNAPGIGRQASSGAGLVPRVIDNAVLDATEQQENEDALSSLLMLSKANDTLDEEDISESSQKHSQCASDPIEDHEKSSSPMKPETGSVVGISSKVTSPPGTKVTVSLPSQKSAAAPSSKSHNLETLRKYFHLPILEVAKIVGVCATAFKKLCRKSNINRWPYRQIRSITKSIQSLEMAALNDTVPDTLRARYRSQISLLQVAIDELIEDPNKELSLETVGVLELQSNGKNDTMSETAGSRSGVGRGAGAVTSTAESVLVSKESKKRNISEMSQMYSSMRGDQMGSSLSYFSPSSSNSIVAAARNARNTLILHSSGSSSSSRSNHSSFSGLSAEITAGGSAQASADLQAPDPVGLAAASMKDLGSTRVRGGYSFVRRRFEHCGPVQLAPLVQRRARPPSTGKHVPLMEPDIGSGYGGMDFLPSFLGQGLRALMDQRGTLATSSMGGTQANRKQNENSPESRGSLAVVNNQDREEFGSRNSAPAGSLKRNSSSNGSSSNSNGKSSGSSSSGGKSRSGVFPASSGEVAAAIAGPQLQEGERNQQSQSSSGIGALPHRSLPHAAVRPRSTSDAIISNTQNQSNYISSSSVSSKMKKKTPTSAFANTTSSARFLMGRSNVQLPATLSPPIPNPTPVGAPVGPPAAPLAVSADGTSDAAAAAVPLSGASFALGSTNLRALYTNGGINARNANSASSQERTLSEQVVNCASTGWRFS